MAPWGAETKEGLFRGELCKLANRVAKAGSGDLFDPGEMLQSIITEHSVRGGRDIVR